MAAVPSAPSSTARRVSRESEYFMSVPYRGDIPCRAGKGTFAPCPPSRALRLKWWARRDERAFAHPTNSILSALDVRAVLGHDNGPRTYTNMRGDGGLDAVGEDGRLVGGRRGLALGNGLGFDQLEGAALRHVDRHRHHVVQRQLDLHILLQIGRGGADDVLRYLHLVVGLGVHEMEAVGIFVEVIEIVVLDGRLLDLVGGLVAFRDLYPVADPAHFDLADRGSLARMDVLRGANDVKLAVLLDDVALANRTGDDFQSCFS